jgi:hypothetical protein
MNGGTAGRWCHVRDWGAIAWPSEAPADDQGGLRGRTSGERITEGGGTP